MAMELFLLQKNHDDSAARVEAAAAAEKSKTSRGGPAGTDFSGRSTPGAATVTDENSGEVLMLTIRTSGFRKDGIIPEKPRSW
jgi:hypothetical protein